MREAAAALDESFAVVKPFADLADHIALKHPGWDHDEFAVVAVRDTPPMTLAPYRAAAAFLRKFKW